MALSGPMSGTTHDSSVSRVLKVETVQQIEKLTEGSDLKTPGIVATEETVYEQFSVHI